MSLFANSKYGPVEYEVHKSTHSDDVTVEVKFIVVGACRGDIGEEKLLKIATRYMEKEVAGRIRAAKRTR
jgi:hypothetical protein